MDQLALVLPGKAAEVDDVNSLSGLLGQTVLAFGYNAKIASIFPQRVKMHNQTGDYAEIRSPPVVYGILSKKITQR